MILNNHTLFPSLPRLFLQKQHILLLSVSPSFKVSVSLSLCLSIYLYVYLSDSLPTYHLSAPLPPNTYLTFSLLRTQLFWFSAAFLYLRSVNISHPTNDAVH